MKTENRKHEIKKLRTEDRKIRKKVGQTKKELGKEVEPPEGFVYSSNKNLNRAFIRYLVEVRIIYG